MEAIHPIAVVAVTECIPAKQLKPLKAAIEEGSNIGFELTAKLSGRIGISAAATSRRTERRWPKA